MRIKHFAGYGCVNAKKVSKTVDNEGYTVMRIDVSGEHEWGLTPYTDDVAVRWLLTRFDKQTAYIDPWSVEVYEKWQGMPKDTIGYMFKYKV